MQDRQHLAAQPKLEQGTVTIGVDDEAAVLAMEVNRARYPGHGVRHRSSHRPV